MAPKGKRKATRVVAKDSSDESADEGATGAAAAHVRKTKAAAAAPPSALLDKAAVLGAVQSMAAANRLPSLFTGEVLDAWQVWHNATPTSLADIPPEERAAATFAMPMKCVAATAAGELPPSQCVQVELLAYRNSAGAQAGITKRDVQRSAEALIVGNVLFAADLPIGSTVALRNAALLESGASDATLQAGEATPFLIGDVVAVEHTASSTGNVAGGAGSSTTSHSAVVERVLVHYRMPYVSDRFCNDVCKPWKLACLCRQEYTKAHERWRYCRAAKDAAVDSTSHERDSVAYLDWFKTDRIFETQVQLNDSRTIKDAAKKSIASHDTSWRQLLGLKEAVPKPTKRKQPPSKKVK